tara:strand:+ start:21292 stop:25623 length:4332 start_codon:yes stop_codon:yes gene_type:complete
MRKTLAFLLFALPLFNEVVIGQTSENQPVPYWIWTDDANTDTAYFRKEFVVPANLTKAKLAVSADDNFLLFINETRAFNGRDWSKIQIEDITALLRKGAKNVIAVRAANEGGAAGFIARLSLETDQGPSGSRIITTDGNWKVSPKAEKGWMAANFTPKATSKLWKKATKLNPAGSAPRELITAKALSGDALRTPTATPVDSIKLPEGFKAELIYSVPKETQGSWVSMTVDDKDRLIVSDQYGWLYRFKTPGPNQTLTSSDVEKIEIDLGGAQGLLWAHDSLYAVLNTKEHGGRGLYRARDTNNDDKLDKVELLKKFEESGGEHGPHAVLLGPDGKSLYVVCGNQTALPEGSSSRVPPVWEEDQVMPRIYGRGFMKGVEAPRGWIAKTDPEGKSWEVITTGFRNEYDAAFNRHGELFSYDADMEWDLNTPWYRPTRINHVISGAEFGWRNGSAKFPEYYSDSFGAVVDIGPGSPTGVVFGYGAKFPAKYQEALFICDWSYGKMYAVHLQPDGSSYKADFEEFMAAQPLPLTDLVIHPDGNMYVAIGGRRVQSGLYRVSYVGKESTKPAPLAKGGEQARELRKKLEKWHGVESPSAILEAWPHLASTDRAIRYAARVALEHQPIDQWIGLAVSEPNPQAKLAAMIAAARVGTARKGTESDIFSALSTLDYNRLNKQQKLDFLRAYGLTISRFGGEFPYNYSPSQKQQLIAQLDPLFPAKSPEENLELSALLGALGAKSLPKKGVQLLNSAPSQEEQIAYAKNLRLAKDGWTPELRESYFQWFVRAKTYKGGAAFGNFLDSIRKDAVAQLNPEQLAALKPILEAKPESTTPQFSFKARSFVKNWTVDDLDDVINVGLEGNRDFANGRNVFGTTGCYACHRFNQEGGAIGPDLTRVAGKFSPRDLLESITNPSKEISDQYGAMIFEMNDGSTVIGRIMNLSGDAFQVSTNMYAPSDTTKVDRKLLKDMRPSPVSMMPPGLINTLEKDDVLDLLAYLLSKGDQNDPVFSTSVSNPAAKPKMAAKKAPVKPNAELKAPPKGFTSLFNGKNLDGWHGNNPHGRAKAEKQGADALKAEVAKQKEEFAAHWSVENGELVNDGHGPYATPDREFGDIEFHIDYKTVAKADSGIYLRGTPQVQIWDYTDEKKWKIGADKGSGGLWNNSAGAPGKDPKVLADKAFGQWNNFRIRQLGARTWVWLNDQPVVDGAIWENYWDRSAPLPKTGPIHLQTHGGEIRWRNIFVKDYSGDEANGLLRGNDAAQGFKSVFNGKDFSGWQGAVENYEVVDGAIRCKPGHGGVLFTNEQYTDHVIRLEFKLPPGGNNGLAIRYPGKGDAAYGAMCELQVLDNTAEKYAKLDPRQYHGSPYGMVPAKRGYLRPVGQWNYQEVTIKGSTIKVELNGSVIVDTDLSKITQKDFMKERPHPGKDLKKGHFGFAGHNDPVMFRNIAIKSL